MQLLVYTKNLSLRRLLDSWINPGPKHRQIKNLTLFKYAPGVVVFLPQDDGQNMIQLLLRLKWKYKDEINVFQLEGPLEEVWLREKLSELSEEHSGSVDETLPGS